MSINTSMAKSISFITTIYKVGVSHVGKTLQILLLKYFLLVLYLTVWRRRSGYKRRLKNPVLLPSGAKGKAMKV